MNTTTWTFVILLALITASGAISVIRKRRNPRDYLAAIVGTGEHGADRPVVIAAGLVTAVFLAVYGVWRL